MQLDAASSIDRAAERLRGRSVLAVLLIAALLRAAWVAAVPVDPVSDSVRYDFFAQRLAAGLGYTEADGRATAYWSVGPSFLYSLVYRLTGPEADARFLAVAAMNLIMGTASVGLTMHLGRKWFSPRVGVVAGLLLALWPSQIQFTTVLASETPMIFFVLMALAAWFADGPGSLLRGILAGAFLAAASYMRPTVLLLPLVIGFSELVRRPQRLETLGGVAAMVAAMLALILPWSLRNYRVFDAFVPISTNDGVNFWMGNSPETMGFYQPPPWGDFESEVDRNRRLRAQALAYIRQDPVAFLKRTLVKAVRLHERESIGVVWNRPGLERTFAGLPPATRDDAIFGIKLTSNIYWWAVLLLAAFGVVRLAATWPLLRWLTSPPVLIWAYFTAVHAVTVIQDRYHFAAIPLVGMLAAVGAIGAGVVDTVARAKTEQPLRASGPCSLSEAAPCK